MLLIDRDGIVRATYVGDDTASAIEAGIEQLLAERPKPTPKPKP
jgi:hypothetical protein